MKKNPITKTRRYKQLTVSQRYEIGVLSKAGYNNRQIAEFIGVHESTLSRERRRNSEHNGEYRAKLADDRARQRRRLGRRPMRMRGALAREVKRLLRRDWSPEQISGHLGRRAAGRISHQTIYKHVWMDRKVGGRLYPHLRTGRRPRRPPYSVGRADTRPKERRRLEERPEVVDQRGRFGDWEVDLMVGAERKGYILTLVERKSRFVRIGWVPRKEPWEVKKLIVRLLKGYRVHTITADNGTEFSASAWLEKELQAQVYFCRPYAPWQRGLCENTNKLLRQYFPRGRRLTKVRSTELRRAEQRLNARPRKLLRYRTPNDYQSRLKAA